LGDLEGRFVYPGTSIDSKRGHWKQSVSLSMGALQEEPGGIAPLLGILKDM